jgi:hypothetical protein
MEPAMKTLAQRCTWMALVSALAVIATSTGHAAPSSPSPPAAPGARPWLEVKLPPAPAAGAATARLELKLDASTPAPAEYAGVKLSVGGAPARAVRLGERVALSIAASATQPLRLEIGGMRVLAHVQPGDVLTVGSGHDGGWVAVIGNRMNENAPKSLTQCGGQARKGQCAAGFTSTRVYKEDSACPAGADDETVYKCVKAPVVRARGPLSGRAEVTNASADGNLDELDTASLAPGPLAAGALGPPISVAIGSEMMPQIRLGDAEAMLVVGPGQSYQVWLDDQGRVDSARAK